MIPKNKQEAQSLAEQHLSKMQISPPTELAIFGLRECPAKQRSNRVILLQHLELPEKKGDEISGITLAYKAI